MMTVTGPDGAVHNFPEGTSPDIIKGVMRQHYGDPKPPEADNPEVYKQAPADQPQEEPMGAFQAGVMGAGDAFFAPQAAGLVGGQAAQDKVQSLTDKAYRDQPVASRVGYYGTYAIPMGGPALRGGAAAVRVAPRVAEEGLRAGGWITRNVAAPLHALMSGDLMGAFVTREAGKIPLAAANRMRTRRLAKAETALSDALKQGYQGTGNPFSGPAPNASIRNLSPEMQAKADAYQAFLRRHSLNQ